MSGFLITRFHLRFRKQRPRLLTRIKLYKLALGRAHRSRRRYRARRVAWPVVGAFERQGLAHAAVDSPSGDTMSMRFEQIFFYCQYDCRCSRITLGRSSTQGQISGAWASIYFANRFPDARRVCARMRRPRTSRCFAATPSRTRISVPMHGALWNDESTMNVVEPAPCRLAIHDDGCDGRSRH